MWMRKSDQQKAQERSRLWLSFRGPAFLFVICFAAIFVKSILGNHSPARQVSWPSTWSEALPLAFFAATLVATAVAIAGYLLQIVLRRKILDIGGSKVVICDACYKTKNRDGENMCSCGGTFDSFDNWTWIDD